MGLTGWMGWVAWMSTRNVLGLRGPRILARSSLLGNSVIFIQGCSDMVVDLCWEMSVVLICFSDFYSAPELGWKETYIRVVMIMDSAKQWSLIEIWDQRSWMGLLLFLLWLALYHDMKQSEPPGPLLYKVFEVLCVIRDNAHELWVKSAWWWCHAPRIDPL